MDDTFDRLLAPLPHTRYIRWAEHGMGRDARSRWPWRAGALLFPFVAFHWIVPWASDKTLGNDYVAQPIHEQLFLHFALQTGTFPLYMPGYAGGQSTSALTLGQLFHPLSVLCAWLPNYWSGAALDWNTLVRLISLGCAHLALFSGLHRLRVPPLLAFLLAGIAVYNLRMLDLFRYGAALETYTGFVFLVAAALWSLEHGHRWYAPLPVAAAVYWVVTSGHPQHAYTALLGSTVLVVLLPRLAAALGVEPSVAAARRLWSRMALAGVAGMLCASVYVLPFAIDFLPSNAGRVGAEYGWTLAHPDTLAGLVNEFFSPLRSDVHGAFGGSSLLLVAALMPLLVFCRVRIPVVVWMLWGSGLLTFLYMLGDRGFVHPLAYRFLPFVNSMRVPGRISLVMPMILVLLLVWIAQERGSPRLIFGRQIVVNAQTSLSFLALLAMAIYCVLPRSFSTTLAPFAATRIRVVPSWVEHLAFASGALSVVAFGVHGLSRRRFRVAAGVAAVAAALQVCLLLPYGTWVEPRRPTPSAERIAAVFRRSVNYPEGPAAYMYHTAVVAQLDNAFLEPTLAKLYGHVRVVDDAAQAFRTLRQERSADDVAIEASGDVDLHALGEAAECGSRRVELRENTFNRLVFDAESCSPAVFGLSFPYSGHWQARVDGADVLVHRINGGQNGVVVPAGVSRVEFRYTSAAASAGVMLSFMAIAAMVVTLAARKGGARSAAALAVVAVPVAVLGLWSWHSTLYAGRSLETRYVWQAVPTSDRRNLAYGKRTWMSSTLLADQQSHRTHASRGVDGDRRPGSGFVTETEESPSWSVDLGRSEDVDTIALFHSLRPVTGADVLDVLVSDDAQTWELIDTTQERAARSPLIVRARPPRHARYLRVRAHGATRLSLDEVEVYGPENEGSASRRR